MIKVIQTILLSLLVAGQINLSYAQTASILPNAKTVFLDQNGKPLVSGTVQFYIPGTTTAKTTWQDSGETIPNTNPVVLDGAGRALILGDGSYRQVVKDRLGNLIWDAATSSTGSGGGGTTATVGDGDAVGTVKPWSGLIAPNQYVFSYGQELARASFPLLFSTITSQQNVSCTSGSPTLTSVGDTSQLPVGAPIESICLSPGATVVSTTISTVTASANAIISTNSSARFFPFGNGDGSSTFNTPDLRGRVLAGRDNMGGVAASRLTSVATGFGAIAALGAVDGNQSQTLVIGNLPPYTPVGTIANGTITITPSTTLQGFNSNNAGTGGGGGVTPQGATIAVSQAGSTFTGTPQGGTSTAFSKVQPTEILNYIIKTLPDTNPNSYFGVASIGGMTGVLTCGFGLTCAGNNISAINSVVPVPTLTTLGGVFQSNAPSNEFAIGVDIAGNILYGGGSTTVNGQVCTIGASCTIVASAGTITVGVTTVSSGSSNALFFNNAGILGNITSANNSILATNGSGVPAWATTIPSAVTGSSLTSVGTLTAGSTGTGFTLNFTNSTKTGIIPVTNGGSSQSTSLAARSSSGFNIDEATSTGDANYTILSTDRMVYHTALTAARTDTLPAANSVNAGQQFIINDFRGVAGVTDTITLQRAGSDTINGTTSLVAINSQFGAGIFWSDGVSRWTFFPATAGGGGGTVTQVVAGNGLNGGTITTSGTISSDPTTASFGGRLTLVSGQPEMLADTTSQNIYLAPDKGRTCPIFNGTIWNVYPFTSSPTDQVGLTLALGGSTNWPAGTIFDVFCINNSGTIQLATRAWDASMLPTVVQVSAPGNTTIQTGTSGSTWTNPTNAFNGTLVQNSATSASTNNGNSNLNNCLGQDLGSGNAVSLYKVAITEPSDGTFRGDNPTTVVMSTYGSNDNTNWQRLDVNRNILSTSATIGNTYTYFINQLDATPYRYFRVCTTGNGVNANRFAQIQFFAQIAPSTRRLTKNSGILVNDAIISTARISSSSTISLAQYQGSYLGSFQTDAATAGQVTANFGYGINRVINIWNYYNTKQITLISGIPATSSAVPASATANYTLTWPAWQDWQGVQSSTSYSVQVLVGYIGDGVRATFARQWYLNGSGASAAYQFGIGIDTTLSPTGSIGGTTGDSISGTDIGYAGTANLIIPPFFGTHTLYGIESLIYNPTGSVQAFENLGNTGLYIYTNY